MYSLTLVVLALAVLVPLPGYYLYCHFNKKEIDKSLVQIVAFSTIIPAITFLTWDEFLDPGAACVVFGAILGFVFGRYVGEKK